MKIKVLARTKKGEDVVIDEVKELAGLTAGICYSSKPFYESLYVEGIDKSINRHDRVIPTGHHSVGTHYNVTILIEGISKMMAIILNSVGLYNTSERSGRYTNLGKDSDLYIKWLARFVSIIAARVDNIDPNYAKKLAMENARYVLPIFQRETTMAYTTNIIELNYICRWLMDFVDKNTDGVSILFDNTDDRDYFHENIVKDINDFIMQIKECGLYIEEYESNKNRRLGLFEDYRLYSSMYNSGLWEVHDRQYCIEQSMSIGTAFAQLLRHRTIDYSIIALTNVFCDSNGEYYTPPILSNTPYVSEWLNDLKAANYIPQAKIISVRESGSIDKFVLKAKERLCSRVQLEVFDITANCTKKLAKEIYSNCNRDTRYNMEQIKQIFNMNTFEIKTKCEILGGCKEPCFFGPKKSFGRRI